MKKINENIEREIALTDALFRISVLESLLINKGIITAEEFTAAMDDISRKVSKLVLQNANVPGDLDAIIDSISTKKSSDNN